MSPEFLAASLQEDRSALGLMLGVSIPDDWPDESPWPRRRLDQLREDPTLQPWLLRAIVLRAEHRMIGHVGFHSRPGEEYLQELAPGGVELGYTVFEKDRRQGYAREACEALMEWAHRSHGVTRFVVSISPANVASVELAKRLGFNRIGSHIDEEDWPEDIFERRMGRRDSS
jgi:RimJ/RimL family protein N-acetyltransferase